MAAFRSATSESRCPPRSPASAPPKAPPLTSLAQDAVDAVFSLLLAFLCLLPLQVGLLLFTFPEFTPQDAADGTHWGREEEGSKGVHTAETRGTVREGGPPPQSPDRALEPLPCTALVSPPASLGVHILLQPSHPATQTPLPIICISVLKDRAWENCASRLGPDAIFVPRFWAGSISLLGLQRPGSRSPI